MPKQPNWYNLNILPTYLVISREQLKEARQQLQNFENCRHKPYVLDNEIIERVIRVYTEQKEYTWILLEQCNKWHKQSLNKQQLEDITEIEDNVVQLKSTIDTLLALVGTLKNNTINSIIEKDDIELAFDFLAGERL